MTTHKPFFELVDNAREASCFKCSGELVDIAPSGFPHSLGEFQADCLACRMATFFDVTPELEEV